MQLDLYLTTREVERMILDRIPPVTQGRRFIAGMEAYFEDAMGHKRLVPALRVIIEEKECVEDSDERSRLP